MSIIIKPFSILYYFPGCWTHTCYSLLDTLYNHLKFSVFRTTREFYLPPHLFFFSSASLVAPSPTLPPPVFIHTGETLEVVGDTFINSTSIYLVIQFSSVQSLSCVRLFVTP